MTQPFHIDIKIQSSKAQPYRYSPFHPTPMSQSPHNLNTPDDHNAALKQHIAALEDQNAELRGESSPKSCGDPYLMTGTSMYDDDDDPQHTEEEERTYQSFQQLLRWVPTVRGLISSQPDGHQLSIAYQKLNRGANSARGDDAASMKLAVASWLNESSPPPNPPIHSHDKTGCGFYNDVTAKLLCPVDFKWADTVAKEGIWNYEPNFQVTAHSWPSFLYRDGEYDMDDPTKGLFKGSFLIRTFKHIFTSPSSAADATQGERRTWSDVATLLGMRSVQPRAIAYSAVQLWFALSSCGSWRNINDDFEHDQFYVYIVDYFENPPTPTAKASVDALLVWWNRKVFGPHSVSTYSPQVAAHYSVANTSAKHY
ncbi:hypothetical protein BDR06DRAFT_1014796 [Suillus hirtellus]|nr:hypothetical protein BDR06DRAFT_1014796 [Suillus hirtellus]